MNSMPEEELRTRRFRALCWSAWDDNWCEAAAKHLEVDASILKGIEAGNILADHSLIERALTVTGCPAHWISEGRLTGMPLEMAIRLGSYDLDLVYREDK